MLMRQDLIKWVNDQLNIKGWSMRELARRGDISSPYLSNVLSGKQEPGAKFFQGMSRAFGVTLESMERLEQVGTIPENRLNDPDLKDLIEIAQKLTDEDLSEVLYYATYRYNHPKQSPK